MIKHRNFNVLRGLIRANALMCLQFYPGVFTLKMWQFNPIYNENINNNTDIKKNLLQVSYATVSLNCYVMVLNLFIQFPFLLLPDSASGGSVIFPKLSFGHWQDNTKVPIYQFESNICSLDCLICVTTACAQSSGREALNLMHST